MMQTNDKQVKDKSKAKNLICNSTLRITDKPNKNAELNRNDIIVLIYTVSIDSSTIIYNVARLFTPCIIF